MPLAGAYSIVSAEAESQGIDITSQNNLPLVNDVGIIGALAAWRVTQGIYRFDPDIYRDVINTPITGDLPHNILFNLPEWCVYVETPGLSFMKKTIAGFYAYLEYDAGDSRKELRFVLDYANIGGKAPGLMSQVIHLGPWPLAESIRRATQEGKIQSGKIFGNNIDPPSEYTDALQVDFAPLVSLLLYICSANGEIGDGTRRPSPPKPVKTKKGPRIFPPNKVTTWDVGVRMGAALRQARGIPDAGAG